MESEACVVTSDVSLPSLSSQLAELQQDLSHATELHKQSVQSAWARAEEMFEKANDKVDSFHKYCTELITRCGIFFMEACLTPIAVFGSGRCTICPCCKPMSGTVLPVSVPLVSD